MDTWKTSSSSSSSLVLWYGSGMGCVCYLQEYDMVTKPTFPSAGKGVSKVAASWHSTMTLSHPRRLKRSSATLHNDGVKSTRITLSKFSIGKDSCICSMFQPRVWFRVSVSRPFSSSFFGYAYNMSHTHTHTHTPFPWLHIHAHTHANNENQYQSLPVPPPRSIQIGFDDVTPLAICSLSCAAHNFNMDFLPLSSLPRESS